MITKLAVKNFKALKDTGDLLLDEAVVLVGPNNSGKTSALQALMLWQLGLQRWMDKRTNGSKAQKRTGVPINRQDLFAIPIKNARMMWTNLFVLQSQRDEYGKIIDNKKVNIEIEVEGLTNGKPWSCGLEFEHRGEEVIYVRPLGAESGENTLFTEPDLLRNIKITFLPPMSGLKFQEEKLLPNTIEARIGEGRTAEVLRNICYQVIQPETVQEKGSRDPASDWKKLTEIIRQLFYVELKEPELNTRGEIELFYSDQNSNQLEVVSAGRGFQQVLLLLSYFLSQPNSTLLLDEPDAHLEILKQKQIYNLLKKMARETNSQIIAASHSEQVLNESVNEDVVLAFYPTSQPHRINSDKEIMKALRDYGFEHYYLANQNGWVLYLEGSTDLDILKAFAQKWGHSEALAILDKAFVHYLNTNEPAQARKHFQGLKDAYPPLVGIAIYDLISNPLNVMQDLTEMSWLKREAENYFFNMEVFSAYAKGEGASDLFELAELDKRQQLMQEVLEGVLPGNPRKDSNHKFWNEEKASKWMEDIFIEYFSKLGLPVRLSKNKYYQLINYLPVENLAIEVKEKLDQIVQVAKSANPGHGR